MLVSFNILHYQYNYQLTINVSEKMSEIKFVARWLTLVLLRRSTVLHFSGSVIKNYQNPDVSLQTLVQATSLLSTVS